MKATHIISLDRMPGANYVTNEVYCCIVAACQWASDTSCAWLLGPCKRGDGGGNDLDFVGQLRQKGFYI